MLENFNEPEHISSEERQKLSGLLSFSQGVLDARSKVQMEMESGRLGVFLEQQISGLPGVEIDGNDNVWLRVNRQHETKMPEPDQHVLTFFDPPSDNKIKRPSLKPAVSLKITIDEASDLLEAGLLSKESVFEIDNDNFEEALLVKVILHLENFPNITRDFDTYLNNDWNIWAKRETPVRKAISLYQDLFKIHSLMHTSEGAPPELICGYGIGRWRVGNRPIDMPLIELFLDIELEDNGSIFISPREMNPQLSLKPYFEIDVSGISSLQFELREMLQKVIDSDDELTPFSKVWEPILITASSKLSSNAKHITREMIEANEEQLKPINDNLTITSTFAIFARPRSNEARSQDLEALRKSIDNEITVIPGSIKGYAKAPEEEETTDTSDWGLENTVYEGGGSNVFSPPDITMDSVSASDESMEVKKGYRLSFFPLPFNEEQGKIAEMIDDPEYDVICVSGPPGTGKSHSIANIICHQMATAKRVLVTARTPEAISAIREKLPDALKSLVIASVGTDRQSVRQLQLAVSALSKEVVSLDTEHARSEKTRLEQKIISCEKKIGESDDKLREIALHNLGMIKSGDDSYLPIDLVASLEADSNKFGWFTDRPTLKPPAQFDSNIDQLRQLLPKNSTDIIYINADVLSSEILPTSKELLDLHKALSSVKEIEEVDYSSAPLMAKDHTGTEERARALLEITEACALEIKSLNTSEKNLIKAVLSDDSELNSSLVGSLLDYFNRFENLDSSKNVTFALGNCSVVDFSNALTRGASGQKPLSFGFFKTTLKEAVNSVCVKGKYPQNTDDWSIALNALQLESKRDEILDSMSTLVQSRLAPLAPINPCEIAAYLTDRRNELEKITSIIPQLQHITKELEPLFPYGIDVSEITEKFILKNAIFALRANLPGQIEAEPTGLAHLRSLINRSDLPYCSEIALLVQLVENPSSKPEEIIKTRAQITSELERLAKKKPELDTISRHLSELEQFGALNWSNKLTHEPEKAVSLIPLDWRKAWLWGQQKQQIENIINLGNGDNHRKTKAEAVSQRRKSLEKLIRIRTMLGLKKRMSPPVLQAMEAYTQAISKIGTGKGKKAPRFIREAQKAAKKAASAVPVWIMPEYKIPEQLPPDFGDFDLVILDEASQSDVTSIAALARGKKILVVGDEEQVSPSNVGITDQKINALRAEFLSDLPGSGLIDENASIFEITKRMHPKSHMMLREHFRCVAPIIQFSTQFYNNSLIPLRVPKASERFDPPLFDVYIENSVREGKLNVAEARWIVDEIAKLISSPEHSNRDIGVISLLGGEQADLIGRMLIEDKRIGPEKIEERRIIYGDARTMQGQERSIVFLSMVATPDNARSQSDKSSSQRANVAMSRAKDRLYLVRSVAISDLKNSDDIKRKILEHFVDPMPDGRGYTAIESQDLMELCDSGFEKEVLRLLLDANYRVKPQVSVGKFSIDLVVEGNEDRRLAIELDGDLYHGPDVWDRDMARQAALERAGWIFWRVFGSQWNNDKEYWFNDLIKTLDGLRIEPIGTTAIDERFTETIHIDASINSHDPITNVVN